MIANDLKVDDENEKVGSQVNKRRKRKYGSVSKNDTVTPGPFDLIIDATNRHHFARTIYDLDLDAGPWVEYCACTNEQQTRSIGLE